MLSVSDIMNEVNLRVLDSKTLKPTLNSEQTEILGTIIVEKINEEIRELCIINALILP